jgi:CheY-like chemotaxis protein
MSLTPSTPSVLVVDDDPLVLSLIRRIAKDTSARMRFAFDAEEAQRMVEMELPALIISDYQMPGMDGMSFLERVKLRHPSVSCVLHTGFEKVRARVGSNIHVVRKPCPNHVLRELIANVAIA